MVRDCKSLYSKRPDCKSARTAFRHARKALSNVARPFKMNLPSSIFHLTSYIIPLPHIRLTFFHLTFAFYHAAKLSQYCHVALRPFITTRYHFAIPAHISVNNTSILHHTSYFIHLTSSFSPLPSNSSFFQKKRLFPFYIQNFPLSLSRSMGSTYH